MAARTQTPYATKASHEIPTVNPIGGKPVFIKHKDIPSTEEKLISNQDIYKCLLGCVQSREIKGVQKIGGLWRLYIETQETRIKLITSGLNVRNANVAVHDTNPFLTDGNENNLRLLIKDIPLSAHDSLITDELGKLKHKVVGPVIYQRLRVDGQLTDCFTGDRIVYIRQPSTPLPRNMNFGLFKAKVFHYGQLPSTTSSTVVCSRCLDRGHHRSQCSNPVVCRRCKQPGHLQLQCSVDFETPPTSPKKDRASGTPSAVEAAAAPPAQSIDELISSGRRAAEHSSLHDNQTRAQAKITQYLTGDRGCSSSSPRPRINSSTSASTPAATRTETVAPSTNTSDIRDLHSQSHSSEASSEESLSDDDGTEDMSEISVESPELPRNPVKESKIKQKKRKQKSQQKPPKKK